MGPGDEDHDLLGVHDGAHAHGERLLRNQAHVAAEETGVCLDRLLKERRKSAEAYVEAQYDAMYIMQIAREAHGI